MFSGSKAVEIDAGVGRTVRVYKGVYRSLPILPRVAMPSPAEHNSA
jgi:hypothetical protein